MFASVEMAAKDEVMEALKREAVDLVCVLFCVRFCTLFCRLLRLSSVFWFEFCSVIFVEFDCLMSVGEYTDRRGV